MNTRHPLIQDDAIPPVLAISFSNNGNRFIAGTSSGLRVFRTDNCLTTYRPRLSLDSKDYFDDRGIGAVAILDDRYLAYVGGGRLPHGGTKATNAVCFWDSILGIQTAKLDFREPILGLRLGKKEMVVILKDRTIILQYQNVKLQMEPSTPTATQMDNSMLSEKTDTPNLQSQQQSDAASPTFDETVKAPNTVRAIVQTSSNDFALGCLNNTLLALPAQTIGQVQLLPLSGGSKRVLKAHTSSLRAICLSEDGSLLATASEQGTLLRVFETSRGDQVAEFRRGVDKAIIFSLAISPTNKWLACTSDKGTLHLFDLAPPPVGDAEPARSHSRNKGSRGSQSYATHRLSLGGATDIDSLSGGSNARSYPMSLASVPHSSNVHQNPGSAQEYYGLKPPPLSATPPIASSGVSAIAAFKSSPFAPKVFKDIRSKVSAPFSIGEEPSHWQGGPNQHWTTMPNGGRKRVTNPVPALAADPSGKPPKGKLLFASKPKVRGDGSGTGSEQEEIIYVVGGGTDARWERFRLVFAEESGGWHLINEGFRRYLTRQFVE